MGVIPSRVAYAVPPHTLPPATLPISAPRRLGSISKSGSGSGRRLESATLGGGGIGTLNTDFVSAFDAFILGSSDAVIGISSSECAMCRPTNWGYCFSSSSAYTYA